MWLDIVRNTACNSTGHPLVVDSRRMFSLTYLWEKLCCFLAAAKVLTIFWKFGIMPPLSLATRELKVHLPSILIYQEFLVHFGIPISSILIYFILNFPLPFGIFSDTMCIFRGLCFFGKPKQIRGERVKELKDLQKE